MVALSDTPNAHAPLYAWTHGEADFARDRDSIRAAIRAFNHLHPEEEEKQEVRWTLAYGALRGARTRVGSWVTCGAASRWAGWS